MSRLPDTLSVKRELWKLRREQLTFQLVGHCMEPTINEGDTVTFLCNPCAVKAGTIAVFSRGDALLAHRVVAVGPRGLITKGDAQEHFDPPVDWPKVLGVVTNVTSPCGQPRDCSYCRVGIQPLMNGPTIGTIVNVIHIAGANGVDILGKLAQHADPKRKPYWSFSLERVNPHDSLHSSSVDSIVSYLALEHIPYLGWLFELGCGILRDGGLLIIVDEMRLLGSLINSGGTFVDGCDRISKMNALDRGQYPFSLARVVRFSEQFLALVSKG